MTTGAGLAAPDSSAGNVVVVAPAGALLSSAALNSRNSSPAAHGSAAGSEHRITRLNTPLPASAAILPWIILRSMQAMILTSASRACASISRSV